MNSIRYLVRIEVEDDQHRNADQPQILSGALCSEEITDIKRSSVCCLQTA